MKRHNGLYNKLIDMENIKLAYHNARKNKTWQEQVKYVDRNADVLLEQLQQSLINHTFHTAKYKTKDIYEPKHRVIYILPFYPDRIVQHAIVNVLSPLWDSMFIYDSYACRKNKGQHKGSKRCMEYARQYEYCLQGDISKFYPSIRHDILKQIIRKKIKDNEMLWLLDNIIDSTNTETNVPIGNFLSQWFGNLFMNELDMYVKHVLHVTPYIRYCDDFLLFGNNKQHLHKLGVLITNFIQDRLSMKLSKLNLFHTYQGVDFLGYRHFHNGKILVRKRTAKRIKKRMKYIGTQLIHNTIQPERALGQIASASGWLKHANTYNLQASLHLKELKEEVEHEKRSQI